VEVTISGGVDILEQWQCRKRSANDQFVFSSGTVAITRALKGSVFNGTFSLSRYQYFEQNGEFWISRWRHRFSDNENSASLVTIELNDLTLSPSPATNGPQVTADLFVVARQYIDTSGTFYGVDDILSPSGLYENYGGQSWPPGHTARNSYSPMQFKDQSQATSAVLCRSNAQQFDFSVPGRVRVTSWSLVNGFGGVKWPSVPGVDYLSFAITSDPLGLGFLVDDGFGQWQSQSNLQPAFFPWIPKDASGNSNDYQTFDFPLSPTYSLPQLVTVDIFLA
jgi:hypothetical protein